MKASFTVMELLITLAIIGVLAALYLKSTLRAKKLADRAICRSYNKQLEMFYLSDPYRQGTSYTQRDFMQMFKISEKCWECHAATP